jgi:hypothetical protein
MARRFEKKAAVPRSEVTAPLLSSHRPPITDHDSYSHPRALLSPAHTHHHGVWHTYTHCLFGLLDSHFLCVCALAVAVLVGSILTHKKLYRFRKLFRFERLHPTTQLTPRIGWVRSDCLRGRVQKQIPFYCVLCFPGPFHYHNSHQHTQTFAIDQSVV